MDNEKIGKLIQSLRIEKNMTQKELADKMNLSDRTISKWERGAGCPDISLIRELSDILEVNVEQILSGKPLQADNNNGGNMKKIKFYYCECCDNVITSLDNADVSCCGRKLAPLEVKSEDEHHKINIDEIENDYFISINHEMSKTHYIPFVAYVSYDRVLIVRLYPEQMAELRLPRMARGKIYVYCNKHGLIEKTPE